MSATAGAGASARERWAISGHDSAVENLAAQVASGRVAHSYLITGPEGVGRTTLALALARALNCDAPLAARPCNTCDSCRRIGRRSHPDVTVVDMEWQDKTIERLSSSRSRPRIELSIKAVRYLRQDIVTRPMQGRWKIQIIDEADKFSDVAPEAFLKTLEEPPPFAVIILIAASPDTVSETILSRCQHVALGAVSASVIEERLKERGVEPDMAGTIARAARGRIAWALAVAGDPKRLTARREKVEEAFEQVTTPLGRIQISGTIARDYAKKRESTVEMVVLWTGLWRDALLHRVGLSDDTAYPEVADRLAGWASRYEIADLYRGLWASQRCLDDLGANVQARIALHAMVMQWPDR